MKGRGREGERLGCPGTGFSGCSQCVLVEGDWGLPPPHDSPRSCNHPAGLGGDLPGALLAGTLPESLGTSMGPPQPPSPPCHVSLSHLHPPDTCRALHVLGKPVYTPKQTTPTLTSAGRQCDSGRKLEPGMIHAQTERHRVLWEHLAPLLKSQGGLPGRGFISRDICSQ